MDKTLNVCFTTQPPQEVERVRRRRRTATEQEIRVIIIRPETPNLDALEQVYEILATTKSA